MKVLVVGGGGREHAIIKSLKKNSSISQIYAAPGNAGISQEAICVNIKATDIEAIRDFAKEEQFDYVVVAPDDPLCLGLVDELEKVNIKAFGPNKAAARIEGSKVYSKNLMKKYNIPTAGYEVFDNAEKAIEYVEKLNCPIVIKADGLALGKGVILCSNAKEAKTAIIEIMLEGKFGKSGNKIVVEEFLTGPEVSVLAFTDGKTVVPMISSMDHKRALDNDEGLNTGGMGVIAPNPCYTQAIAKVCLDTIFIPTIKALQEENSPFKGCLYFGLMLTENGPKVIEYNCRFGDPETQAILPLLKSDLLTIMLATTEGTLDSSMVEFEDSSSCTLILASGGYPEKYENGKVIKGLKEAEKYSEVIHAGTKLENGEFLTNGGRVLAVTTIAQDLKTAIEKSYKAADLISFDNMHRRSDIGQKALKEII